VEFPKSIWGCDFLYGREFDGANARTEPRPECGGLGAGAAPSSRHDACRASSSSDLLATGDNRKGISEVSLFVVSPHTNNFDRRLFCVNLIDEAMLNVNPS